MCLIYYNLYIINYFNYFNNKTYLLLLLYICYFFNNFFKENHSFQSGSKSPPLCIFLHSRVKMMLWSSVFFETLLMLLVLTLKQRHLKRSVYCSVTWIGMRREELSVFRSI